MKIAIVIPHPVPLALGGAENLWWGLQKHLHENTEHSCDIVSLISPEGSFWELIDSYEAFAELDLSAYDLVISGKYPAWMVEHPNHVVYLLHRLRGLYDTYRGDLRVPEHLGSKPVRSLLDWMAETDPDIERVTELIARVRALRERDLPEELFAFPGPFIRQIVHYLDDAAMAPKRIRRYAANAANTAGRDHYFPDGVPVLPLHHPPHRTDYYCEDARYFFTSSRLDGAKRFDLIIEAMRHVDGDTELLIAGTGPDEERLKALAANDKRIRFLGYVADDEMPGLYANALAVPFTPYDEDYGLITVEAMLSSKPVVTTSDAGGPCELVRDGENGFITAPDPASIGARLSMLAADQKLAKRMGAAGRDAVAHITWENVAEALLEQDDAIAAPAVVQRRRPKLTIANTFPADPPRSGGQARVFHLNRHLARVFDIDIVALCSGDTAPSRRLIAPGLVEYCVPHSERHVENLLELGRHVEGAPIDDVTAFEWWRLTPDYVQTLESSAFAADAMIACHPYLVRAIRHTAPTRPMWYEAHNVELTLKQKILTGSAAPLLPLVESAEREAWLTAERVYACADRDLEEFARLYGPTRARQHQVPNGVALETMPYFAPAKRKRLRDAAGLPSKVVALFVGSWHGPNVEALQLIIDAAADIPFVDVMVMGSVCMPFMKRELPANIHLLGAVDDQTRNALLASADVALNPMLSGSGTNLKMLDYFAAGIPVISTRFGARGLLAQPDTHYVEMQPDGLAQAIERFAEVDREACEVTVSAARRLVEAEYDWKIIAERFLQELEATGFPVPR
ncbi:glycosyl transferase [Devosia pacifica]|uniref:Glycosyl transferase n=1 Tax=Devosia pacifica TaxID=1335967 RepID=A0A918SB08_9HYPH|nr:glycosyltransferase family 4 protein [Devosia pacifica]GHA32606.1 glycosyl transferase [Devosia pacifica]